MKRFMLLAINSAEGGIKKFEGGPFGACIVKNNKVISVAHNTVLKNKDPTCHAEINAIRKAAKKIGYVMKGCTIYSTTEPCPMCFSAIHWANISKVVFGTGISDVMKRGFNELALSSKKMKKLGKSKVKIQSGFMKKECNELLSEWDRLRKKKTY